MHIAGIIAEFNPFHSGHNYLIQTIRQQGATHIAVVMSGNFVQRGEPAILSKTARTKQALLCGADLVAELPLPWAIAGAESFAAGGVSLLERIGAQSICFGSEHGSTAALKLLAQTLLAPNLKEALKAELSSGCTFAKARKNAVESILGPEYAALLEEPNNILGIEYIKAMIRQNSSMELCTVARLGPAHDAAKEHAGLSSASRIRQLLHEKAPFQNTMPPAAAAILLEEQSAGRAPADLRLLERAILAKLRTMPAETFRLLPDISEGLENRVYAAAQKAASLDELYTLCKTKRYTMARIRRVILSAFLGVTAQDVQGLPPYLRILGMTQKGRELLPALKSNKKQPLIVNTSDILTLDNRAANVIELEHRSYDLFSLCMPTPAPCGMDRTAGVIKL